MAQLFAQQGFNVSFAGWESPEDGKKKYHYRGHSCFPMAEFREKPLPPYKRAIGFLFRGHHTLRWLYNNNTYKTVIVYNPPALFCLGLFVLQKLHGFTLILDSTEWFESEHLPGGKYSVAAIENWVRMHWVYPRFKHIICISRFLEKHYTGSNTINIPPLTTFPLPSASSEINNLKINFLYAGNAGKKDLLIPFIRVLPKLQNRLNKKVRLDIAGSTWDDLAQQIKSSGLNPDAYLEYVHCHGRIRNDEIPALYEKADFSILFREEKRYAHAGFPTKAVESWSMGCPIILNKVGDIGHIATHMQDSIIVRIDKLEEDLVCALDSINTDHLASMRMYCLSKIQHNFTAPSIEKLFLNFISRIGNHP
ncbi:glycosyltransferase family 4 protein [Crenobacter intestini]|uniref:glycosyltransferase family 4 protein n=1 Tax=Crenobacter intestini TaxID=2563443 RepID=UPI001458ADDA|nr:glycosyltransferase family 4 protein [Crenobacter intestini]